jgi:cell division protein FtsI (penicillin-binding protein 3)
MQDIVHHELYKACEQHKASGGVAILMETKTGAIKAISNLTKGVDSTYFEMYNNGVGQQTEPGSTIKLATVLALMEDGVSNPDTLVNLNYGKRKFADREMHDSEPHGRVMTTMQEAFEISSNVGIAALANDRYNTIEGRKQWIKRLKQFGLADQTGIDLSNEPVPYIKDPIKDKAKWYGTTIPWMAHGYELLMTPLQVLNFYNAVANNGKMMRPYLVSEIYRGEEIKAKYEPKVLNPQIASAASIAKAKKMLEGVFERGTAEHLKSKFVTMAGKTGTAKTNYANKGEHGKYNGSLCGYFPAHDPMYTMIVVIYEPNNGVYYGGYTAGIVFKNVAEKVYAMKTKQVKNLNDEIAIGNKAPGAAYGFAQDFNAIYDYLQLSTKGNPETDWAITSVGSSAILINDRKVKKNVVPDVRGMGVRDATYLLENTGLRVKINGVGKVVQQSIAPGVKAGGQYIVIELR